MTHETDETDETRNEKCEVKGRRKKRERNGEKTKTRFKKIHPYSYRICTQFTDKYRTEERNAPEGEASKLSKLHTSDCEVFLEALMKL